MRPMIRSLCILLLTACSWAQASSASGMEKVAIRRAKSIMVSSLDRSLPHVNLEFFLKNEGGGALIQWKVSDCGKPPANPATDHGDDSPVCVQARFAIKDGNAVTVLVSVGKCKAGPAGVPKILQVSITNMNRIIRSFDHLGDLPMELHRPGPKPTRDLPFPVDAPS